jgi:hypothetical protein
MLSVIGNRLRGVSSPVFLFDWWFDKESAAIETSD